MNKTKKLVLMALFTAISIVLLYVPFLRFPIFAAAPFLEYDAMDVPILLGGMLIGGGSGLAITLISCLLQGLTVSSSSGIYGIIMHLIATGAFVGVSSLVSRGGKGGDSRVLLGLIAGALARALVMIPANLLITSYFMGVEVQVIKSMLLPVFIPFNLIVAGINAAVTFILYLPVKRALK